jgi:hypothetical protein
MTPVIADCVASSSESKYASSDIAPEHTLVTVRKKKKKKKI